MTSDMIGAQTQTAILYYFDCPISAVVLSCTLVGVYVCANDKALRADFV